VVVLSCLVLSCLVWSRVVSSGLVVEERASSGVGTVTMLAVIDTVRYTINNSGTMEGTNGE